jgi:hypothetical protein
MKGGKYLSLFCDRDFGACLGKGNSSETIYYRSFVSVRAAKENMPFPSPGSERRRVDERPPSTENDPML